MILSLWIVADYQNHNYIERGILDISTFGESSTSHALAKSYISSRSTHTVDKDALLREAELDIVEHAPETVTPSANRRMIREGTAFSTASAMTMKDLPLPGAWVRTPREKRKRAEQASVQSQARKAPSASADDWGIPEWKRLEKVFTAEKSAWVAEREKKSLPVGSLIGWARRASGMGVKSSVMPWDNERVVTAFMSGERKDKREWDE